jgi:hypothetical protein
VMLRFVRSSIAKIKFLNQNSLHHNFQYTEVCCFIVLVLLRYVVKFEPCGVHVLRNVADIRTSDVTISVYVDKT